MGLGQLLGNQGGGAQAPVADQQPVDPAPVQPNAKSGQPKSGQPKSGQAKSGQPNTKPKPVADGAPADAKKGKKRQAAQQDAGAEQNLAPEAAAQQLMQNFLGNYGQ